MSWKDIPKHEPLDDLGAGEGPGIGSDLERVRTDDILNTEIAVIGFSIRPSTYENTDEYAQIEIMDATENLFLWSTSAAAILRKLRARFERNQVPFKTVVVKRANKAGTRQYLDFDDGAA